MARGLSRHSSAGCASAHGQLQGFAHMHGNAAEGLWHACRQHERMSVELLEDILGGEQSHTISRDLSDEEIKHIEAMITCEKGGQPAPSGKRWLYEVSPSPSKCHIHGQQVILSRPPAKV